MDDIKKSAEKKMNEGADRLREGLEKARREGVGLVEETFPRAEEAIERAQAKGGAYWNKAKHKGQEIWMDVEIKGQEKWEQVSRYVQRNPGKSVGYAILGGLLLGFLLYPKGGRD